MNASQTAGKIINGEFGDKNFGRGVMRSAAWWPELLERITELCEKSYEKGQEKAYEEGLPEDKEIVPKADAEDYKKSRESMVLHKPSTGPLETLEEKIKQAFMDDAMDKLPNLTESKPDPVPVPMPDGNGCCKQDKICKYFEPTNQ